MGRIVIITPARDEEKYIHFTLNSIVNQTIQPVEWLILDDGSNDRTKEIAEKYANEYSWIRVLSLPDRGERVLGSGVVHTFNYGLENLQTTDYDFICKLDADLTLPENYFEFLLAEFTADTKLGIASGCTYIENGEELIWERTYEKHTRGMMKVYRRTCFQEIGGLIPNLGWDVVDDYMAHLKGWDTQNHKELKVIHHRPMGSSGKGIIAGKIRWGKIHYLLNYHPLFSLGSCFYRMLEKPYILSGILMIYGYLSCFFNDTRRIAPDEVGEYIRSTQIMRLKKVVGL